MSFLPGLFPAGAVARAVIGGGPFPAGDQTAPDLYALVQQMAASSDDMAMPAAGGTLTINGESLGAYDYVIKDGDQTISFFFSASDWFTNTADSRSAFIVVKGNLTIDSGPILTPPVRKLFTTIYVTGDLAVNGGISMTARGANHSSSGSNISAAAIRIATGTYSGVTNPQVPAAGAAGSPGTSATGPGVAGSDGTDGQTGGGGAGGANASTAGKGAAGTSFSGGSGSGGGRAFPSQDAKSNGGAGSDGAGNGSGGGAGNPGGKGSSGGFDGGDGTGGVLIVICEGTLSGSGTISADGVAGGNKESGQFRPGGGGSGGGSVTVLYGMDSGPTPTAAGGAGGIGDTGLNGGKGGDGTARKLAL